MYSTSKNTNAYDINNIHLQVSMINKNKTNSQRKNQCSCYIFCILIFMSAQKNWPESHISQSDTEIGDRLIHVYAYFTQSIHVYAYFVHSLLNSTATFFRSWSWYAKCLQKSKGVFFVFLDGGTLTKWAKMERTRVTVMPLLCPNWKPSWKLGLCQVSWSSFINDLHFMWAKHHLNSFN